MQKCSIETIKNVPFEITIPRKLRYTNGFSGFHMLKCVVKKMRLFGKIRIFLKYAVFIWMKKIFFMWNDYSVIDRDDSLYNSNYYYCVVVAIAILYKK